MTLSPLLTPGRKVPRPTTEIPAATVGTWRVAESSFTFEVLASGHYYITAPPCTYTIKDNTLTFAGTPHERQTGSDPSIIGSWLNSHHETITFRPDNTYTSHWPDNEEYHGNYQASDTELSLSELRAFITTDGNSMTFSIPYSKPITGTYIISSNNEWSFTDSQNRTVTYTRI